MGIKAPVLMYYNDYRITPLFFGSGNISLHFTIVSRVFNVFNKQVIIINGDRGCFSVIEIQHW